MAIVQTNNTGRVAFPKGTNTNVRKGYATTYPVIYQVSPNYRLGILTGKSWQIEGEWTWFELVTPKNELGWVRRDVFTVDLSKPLEPVPAVTSQVPAASTTSQPAVAPEPYRGPDQLPLSKPASNGMDLAIWGLGAIAAIKLFGGKKGKRKKRK